MTLQMTGSEGTGEKRYRVDRLPANSKCLKYVLLQADDRLIKYSFLKSRIRDLCAKHPGIQLIAVPCWLAVTLQWGRLRYWTLRHWFHNSIFVQEWEMGMCSHCPEPLLRYVLDRFRPRSVLDFGCGTGRTLDYLLARGLDVQGVEGSAKAISLAKHTERIRRHDFENPLALGRSFDLLWCFEVVEHIRPAKADVLLDSLARHADVLVISAARPGQGGDGHFNEQPPEYWIARLQRRGFSLLPDETAALRAIPVTHSENMLVFQRTPMSETHLSVRPPKSP